MCRVLPALAALLIASAAALSGCLGAAQRDCVVSTGDFLIDISFLNAHPTRAAMAHAAATVNATGNMSARPFLSDESELFAAGLRLSSRTTVGSGGGGSGILLLTWMNGSSTTRSSLNFVATTYVSSAAEGNASLPALEGFVRARADLVLPILAAEFGAAAQIDADIHNEVRICTFSDGI